MLLLEAACAGIIAFVFEKGLNALGIPNIFSIAIATALFIALLGIVLKYTENATYVLYLLCDTIWTWEFSHRQRPEWDQRIDRFAQHLVNVAKSSDADEIVIVGHSSGSFLSTEMLARALKLDPALGRHRPRIVLLAEAIGVGAIAVAIEWGLRALGIPNLFSIAVAAAVFVAVLGTVLKYTENRTYVLYLLSDTIWTWDFSHRQRPDWDQRIDRFAQHLVKVAGTSSAEEIVLVGHSSGSFLGVEILARALRLDPALGRHGPRVVLFTIGGNFPIVGYHAASQDFRDHMRQLAIEPSIDWIDCQARKDVMNFFQFDPLAAHGIDVGDNRRNPTIVPVRFREVILPEHYNAFRRQFFRVHFQFVMANEVPHAYDFFMIVCGPVPLAERMALPQAALTVATGDPTAREWAWKQLENARSGQKAAEELGSLEPTARRRR